MRLRVRQAAHLFERTGLALAGAACGTFVGAHVGTSVGALTTLAFLLAMIVVGAVGFYLGIDIPPLPFHSDEDDAAAKLAGFDIVLSMEVVEHVADVSAFVAACCNAVKPGGLLVMATLNRTLKSFALAIVGAEYVLRWLPRGTHSWEKFVTPRELETEIRKSGLHIDYRGGVIFNPLLNQWKLSRDMDVNYMLVARRR